MNLKPINLAIIQRISYILLENHTKQFLREDYQMNYILGRKEIVVLIGFLRLLYELGNIL